MKNTQTRRFIPCLLSVVAAASLNTGCHVATSTRPIGNQSISLAELPLEGVWRSSEGQPFFVRIVDAPTGRLEVANVTTNQDGFLLERHEVILRQQSGVTFANLRSRDPNPDENYTFGRLMTQENTLILTLASSASVRTLALQGAAGAIITTNQQSDGVSYSVIVTNGFENLANRLAAPDGWQWLDTGNPIVLTRQKTGLN